MALVMGLGARRGAGSRSREGTSWLAGRSALGQPSLGQGRPEQEGRCSAGLGWGVAGRDDLGSKPLRWTSPMAHLGLRTPAPDLSSSPGGEDVCRLRLQASLDVSLPHD